MSSVDNRIVNMVFNNKGFESGIATTLSSLKKLDEKLKMKTDTKGFGKITEGIQNLKSNGLSGLSSGVETVSAKFSALGVIGATALANITNKAVNAGTAMVKAFTIDPIKSGFEEYETKINAIQTILSNTAHQGTTLPQVTDALNELNTYADKTIYNFAQMTENIGRFTAAGVDLDTSVASIKGIANLAAASGSSPAQATSAMYQLSQAIASGRVNLQDWNSVVNAGMGGKLFQDALKETAKQMGVNIDASKSFRDSLQDGWLSAEVLTKTLNKFANDPSMMKAATEVKTITGMIDAMKESVQSGWAQSWEFIIGNKDQATKLLTSISDAFTNVVNPISDARNEMLKFWNQNGGRDAVINGLGNAFGSLGKVLGSVRDGFREVFPAMTGEKLVALSKGFENFTKKLKVSDKTASKIKDTFKGFFSVIDLGKTGITSLVKGLAPALSIFPNIGKSLVTVTGSIGKFFSKLNISAKSSGVFDAITKSLGNGIKSIVSFCDSAANAVGKLFDALSNLNFAPIMDFIKQIGSGFGKGLETIFTGLGKALGTINFNTIFGAIGLIAGKDMFGKVGDMFKSFGDSLKNLTKAGDSVKGILDTVKDSLLAFQNDLKAGTLLKIAGAIALLAASLTVLSTIDANSLGSGLSGITVLMAELVGALAILSKMNLSIGSGFMGGAKIATTMIAMATALLILAGAVKMMSGLNLAELATGLAGIAGAMLVLVGSVKLMDTGAKGLSKSAAGMIALGVALNIMALAVKQFAKLKPEDMLKGLAGIAGALAELLAFMKLLGNSKMTLTSATSLGVLAVALIALQNAISRFGEMKMDALQQGLVGMAGALAAIAAFTKLSGSAGSLLVTASAMVVMGGAMIVLANALKSFGSMNWNEIGQGLTALAGGLTIIGVAVRLISGLNLATTGAGLLVMSAALLVMGNALKNLAEMSWEELGRGLVALAGGLLVLGVAMAGMTAGLAGAGAMLVMSAALAVFTPQLLALSGLSWSQLAVGLTGLAGAFTVLGVAGLVLTPLVPSLLGLSGAIALLGVGCLAAGTGVTLFAGGLAALAAVLAGSGYAMIDILKQLINLIPQLGTKLGEGLANMAVAIGQNMPQLAQAFTDMITGMLQAVSNAMPQITQTMLDLITSMCKVLSQSAPMLASAAADLIVALLDGLSKNIGKIADKGAEVIVQFIDGISRNIGQVINAAIELSISFVEGLANGIESNAGRFQAAVSHLISASVNAVMGSGTALFRGLGNSCVGQLISGIASRIGQVASTVRQGISSAVSAARSFIGQFLSAGAQMIGNLVSGIRSRVSQVASTVRSAVSGAVRAARSGASQMVSAGSAMIQGLISGIKSAAGRVAAAAKSVVQGAINAAKSALKINSPSKVFIEIGAYTSEGMAIGIDKNARMVEKSSENMVNAAVNNVKNSVRKIADAVNMDVDANPTITPVLDLSNIQEGSRTIGQLLATNNTLPINANVTGVMSRSIGRIQNGSANADVVSALKDLQKTMSGNSGNTYQINGITYDDGSAISAAVETLVRAAMIERRI